MSKKDPPPPGSSPVDIDDESDIMTSSTSLVLDQNHLVPKEQDDGVVSGSRPAERVTFSNLAAFVPEREEQPTADDLVRKPVRAEPSVSIVKPPSFARFIFLVIILVILLVTTWIGWRMDWNWSQIGQDPGNAFQIALGIKDKPRPVVVQPRQTVQVDELKGRLQLQKLRVERVVEKKAPTIRVGGDIHNQSNRIQHSIALKVSVNNGQGLTLASRRIECCSADKPTGPANVGTRLKPGERAGFLVEFTSKQPFPDGVKPKVEIVFSETERVQ